MAIVTYNIGKQLAQSHEVTLVAAQGEGEAAREALGPHLEVRRVRSPLARLHKYRELAASAFEAIPPHFLSSWYFWDFYAAAARALESAQPDVVHIQNYSQCMPLFRAVLPKARFVVHLHDTALAQVPTRVARRIVEGATLIVCCSEYVARSIRTAHPDMGIPVHAVRNGVDVTTFRQHAAPSGETLELAYIGRLSPEKGVHVLIEAFNRVIERVPHARLSLHGGSAMFAYAVVKVFKRDPNWAAIRRFYGNNPLQRLLRQLRAPGQRYVTDLRRMQTPAAARATRYLGDQPHAEIANALQATDLVVVPSVCDEPFGIPAVEAMAAALPVVASAAGGLTEIVQDRKSGLLVPRSDADALAEAILTLAQSNEQRAAMGRAGRAIAESTFTWSAAVASLQRALAETGLSAADSREAARHA